VLISAMANANENHRIAAEDLKIATIMVDEGPRLKRMRARAQGRGNRIIKKTSHITVVVEDFERTATVRPHGTKAKPRPSFAAPAKGKKRGHAPAAKPAPEPEIVEETPVAATPEPVVAAEPVAAAESVAAPEPEVIETPAPEETAPEAASAEIADAPPEPSAASEEPASGETKETS